MIGAGLGALVAGCLVTLAFVGADVFNSAIFGGGGFLGSTSMALLVLVLDSGAGALLGPPSPVWLVPYITAENTIAIRASSAIPVFAARFLLNPFVV